MLFVAIAAVVVPTLLLPPAPAGAETDQSAGEAQFIALINEVRTSRGLRPLTPDPELRRVAMGWAEKMAAADQISHNPKLAEEVSADWQKLGENVGVGMTVQELHDAFVKSPSHLRNILDPDFTRIGVAIVVGRGGALFTTHQFMKLRPRAEAAAAAASTTTPPTTARRARPTQVAGTEVAAPTTTAAATPAAPSSAAAQPTGRLVLVLEQLRALDQR